MYRNIEKYSTINTYLKKHFKLKIEKIIIFY